MFQFLFLLVILNHLSINVIIVEGKDNFGYVGPNHVVAEDVCANFSSCATCLMNGDCGWIHGVADPARPEQGCQNFCAQKDQNGTGPASPVFAAWLAVARSSDCPCRPHNQCGIFFNQVTGCPRCEANIICDTCVHTAGCNMCGQPPFGCHEYTFMNTPGETTSDNEDVCNMTWVGESCSALCETYSFTDCVTCVQNGNLNGTGVTCGWCGGNQFVVPECMIKIDDKPDGDYLNCASGNQSCWFPTIDACLGFHMEPISPGFPVIAIAFIASTIVLFALVVIAFAFYRRKQLLRGYIQIGKD